MPWYDGTGIYKAEGNLSMQYFPKHLIRIIIQISTKCIDDKEIVQKNSYLIFVNNKK